MHNVDPDILAVLKTVAATPELVRQAKVKVKHEKQLEETINTHVELLADEVERVIPKDHPLFMPVLMSTVIRKVARIQQEKDEQEYKSFLDQFPKGW